jgi:uncharacterized protein
MHLRKLLLLLLFISPCIVFSQDKFIPSSTIMEQALKLAGEEQYDKAIAKLRTIDRSDTAYALTLLRLAALYNLDDQQNRSIEACNEGLKLNSEYQLEFYNQKAKTYIDKEQYSKGREALREGLKHFPYSALMNYNMGYAYFKDKMYDSSFVYLEECLKNNVYFSSAHYLIGCIALAQGHNTKGLMAWSFYLQIKPEGEGSLKVLKLMESVSKNVSVISEEDRSKEFQDNKDFGYIDQLVKGLVAVDKKYKTKVAVDAAVVKQMQLIFDQFKYNPESKDLYMRMYGKLFDNVQKAKLADAYMYVMLSSLDNSKVNKWKKKNDSKVKAVFAAENSAVQPLTLKKEVKLPNQEGIFTSWYSQDRTIYALGNAVDDLFKNKTGYWRYYHPEYSYLVSEGSYSNNLREGEWTYYYTGQRIKKKSTFKNDTLNGPAIFYGENGNVSTRVNYVNGFAEGEVILYYPSGNKKEVLTYKKDERDGPAKYYYCTGQLSDEYTYKKGNIHGAVTSYHPSGTKRQEINFTDGKLDGSYVTYHENGKIKSKGVYKGGEPVGKWVFYYENGNLSQEGEYDEAGKWKGEWKEYYENGKLSETKTYTNGKATGNINYYDEDGVLHYTLTVNKGEFTGYTYYDKQGKVIATANDKKGNHAITGYDANGVKTFEGRYESGAETGEWKYYHPNGKLRLTRTYQKGVLEGPAKEYSEREELIKKCYYVNNKLEGYYVEYYSNGQKSNEGYMRDGLEQGPWKQWHANGKPEKESYFMDGTLEGYKVEYTTTGKKATEVKYSEGLKYIVTSFDTSGNSRIVNDFSKGSGKWISKYASGKTQYEGNVSCHELNGKFTWYHPDGSVSNEHSYTDGNREGAFKTYHPNGKIYIEGAYSKDRKHGKWVWYYDNGKVETTGYYDKGKSDSVWVFYYDNGKKDTEAHYKKGERDGPLRFYNLQGEMVYEKHYKDGEVFGYTYLGADGKPVPLIKLNTMNDQLKAFFPNGKMSALTEYKDGSFHGKDQAWYSNGQLFYENNYEKGAQTGLSVEYYPNGNKKTEANYFFGDLDGVKRYYREDGTLEKTETYVLGDLNGKTEHYDKNGKVIKTEFYWNDSIY